MRKYSSQIVDGKDRSPSRSMLRAVGFKDKDFKLPQIGVASTWSMVTPCNMHIDELAKLSAKALDTNGGKSSIFNTITISDGISMGTEGMKYSLVSREVIADSIETVMGCEGLDGLIAIGGCDKNMPACIIAMARLNRPSVFIYGGTILPGVHRSKKIDIVSVFEAVGKNANNEISNQELTQIEKKAIPGPGSCGGMYTANTMACAIEALGMSLTNSSAQVAISSAKKIDCRESAIALMRCVKKDIKPMLFIPTALVLSLCSISIHYVARPVSLLSKPHPPVIKEKKRLKIFQSPCASQDILSMVLFRRNSCLFTQSYSDYGIHLKAT